MAFSKVKDKNFKVIKYEEGKSPAARRMKLILIIVATVAVVGVSAYLLFSPRGSAPGVRDDSPQEMVRAYGDFVGPYVPPSGLFPTQIQVGQWLEFFDRSSQQWFRDNADKLSFLGARRDAETWQGWNHARRESEAMRYLVTQAPLRGGVINEIRKDEGGARARVELRSRDQTHQFNLVRESGGWRFSEMMGRRQHFQQSLADVTLP